MMDAARILDQSLVVDGCQFAEGELPGPTERLGTSRVDGVVFTVSGPGFAEAAAGMGRIHELASRHHDRLRIVRRVSDLDRAKRSRATGIILAFQDPSPIENRIELLRVFYELGLRVLQLTYNKASYLGAGCCESVDSGLTDFGCEVVRAANRLGIVVDLSHVGRKTALAAIEKSEAPVVFSHACTHALAPSPRNRTDEEIQALAGKGGVIGLCPWGPICWKGSSGEPPGLEDYLDHVEHVRALVGADHIGFGSDQTVDGSADEAGILHQGRLYPQVVGEYDRRVGATPEVRYARGFRGAHELGNVVEGLLRRGFSEADVGKFLGGNFGRVFDRVWSRNDA